MLRSLAAALIFASVISPSAAQRMRRPWAIGVEREVYPGNYATLISVSKGWRVWRFETRDGVSCDAFKAPAGKPSPIPSGDGLGFHGGEPFARLFWTPTRERYILAFSGRQPYTNFTEFRRAGERFWTDLGRDTPIGDLDGATVQVHVQSARFRDSSIGAIDEYGLISLAGLNEAIAAATACTAKH